MLEASTVKLRFSFPLNRHADQTIRYRAALRAQALQGHMTCEGINPVSGMHGEKNAAARANDWHAWLPPRRREPAAPAPHPCSCCCTNHAEAFLLLCYV